MNLGNFSQLLFVISCLAVCSRLVKSATNAAQLESCVEDKDFKNLLKTRPNLLVLFTKTQSDAKDVVKLLKEVSVSVKGIASIATVNCENAKKLCKKLKISPQSYELKHYNQGTFYKDYDRQLVKKSMITFLKDPKGDMPWDEDTTSKDVVHLKSEAVATKLIKKAKPAGLLVMFYAPWCGFCKKLKPEYAAAATELKNQAVLAAADVEIPENSALRRIYNISGYPTLLYFKDGEQLFKYEGEYTKSSLIEWMKNPQPPKEKEKEKSWADEDDVNVTFLTDETFDNFIETHANVLVKFYAPWCGYCKKMKPVLNQIAKQLKEEGSPNTIAFVDATEQTQLAKRFKVKGYPTVKFFQQGSFAWDYDERDETKILEFMRNPVEPPQKFEEPQWQDEKSFIVHADSTNFASTLKTKKHALVMFYAPWCGHCKKAKPEYKEAAEQFKEDTRVAFVAVDCTQNKPVCDQYEVKGFPTILYFNFGKNPTPYDGGREAKNFIKFMSNPNDPNSQKQDQTEEWSHLSGYEHVNFLDDSSFDEFIYSKQKVLVMFYAPWCGHCKNMKPAYVQAARDLTSFVPGSYLAAVDATKSPKLSQRFELRGFPTLKLFEQGKFKFDYEGGRSKEDLVGFMRGLKQEKKEL